MNAAAPVMLPKKKAGAHQTMRHQDETRGKKTFVQASSKSTSCACDGSCPRCQTKNGSLNVSKSNDSAEIQADLVAHKIMQMPAQENLTLSQSNHSSEIIQRKCDSCKDGEEKIQRKVLPSSGEIPTQSPTHVKNALGSGGKPLDGGTRNFFESRFDRDFSNVRVHTGAAAEKSARDLDAKAYTLGHNVVFGAKQFVPATHEGRSLLAHELTHVIQQSGGGKPSHSQSLPEQNTPVNNQALQRNTGENTITSNISSVNATAIHRACGSAEIGEPSGCVTSTGDVSGLRYLFQVNCDDFAIGNEEDLRMDTAQIQAGDTVDIHGLASSDGDAVFNMNLSCARALRARAVVESVLSARGISATINVFNHGATPGDVTQQRSVVVSITRGTPALPPPAPIPATPSTPAAPTFPSTPQDCTPPQTRRSASGCTPNPGGSGLPEVGGTHTESHPFEPCDLTEAQVASSPNWCVDRQQAHGGEVCYREIPTVSRGPGRQFCYSENCCHNSADAVSVVDTTSPGSGSCCETNNWAVPGHVWDDVVPEFFDDPCRVTRDITGFDPCPRMAPPWRRGP
jgi:Domain of unknown function (DUF4157)